MVRTVTSLNRVLDVLAAFADDTRIAVEFAIDPGSEFGTDLIAGVEALGGRAVAWPDAADDDHHLVVTASDNCDLSPARAPVLLVQHGAGFHKYAAPSGPRPAEHPHRSWPSGLSPAALRYLDGRRGRLVLAHENERRTVAAVDPVAARAALVAGDPSLDRLRAAVRVRDRYRAALGIPAHTRVVTVASTWGSHSVLGTWPDLPAQLLADLPYDEYRVIATLHPNIWARFGAFQVCQWLQRAVEAGLVLLPHVGPWEVGLAAADFVVGDHGSQTTYALELGLPVLLAAGGGDEVVAGSPMAEIVRRLSRLHRGRSLADQVDKTVASHNPSASHRLVEHVFAHRGRSLDLLRDAMYEMLRLPPPSWRPRVRPVTGDLRALARPSAFHVEAVGTTADISGGTLDTEATRIAAAVGTAEDRGVIVLRRYPAVVSDFGDWVGRSRHLVVEDIEAEPVLAESAAILLRRESDQVTGARDGDAWSAEALGQFPACRMAAAVRSDGQGIVAWARGRDGVVTRAELDVRATPRNRDNMVSLAASGLYTRLVATGKVERATFEVRSGPAAVTVRVQVPT